MRYAGVLFGVWALMGSCASVRPITGGEPDTISPRMIAASPMHRSTGFHANTILLEFDERIQLERVRERLLISPPLETPPLVRLAGPRSVEIALKAPLLPNTTYTFNLGESVKDLTEGNVATGLSYVVSTGEELDSAAVAGTITNAFTGAPEKLMNVGLYAADDTTAFRTGRPTYMTRTDATGKFLITNLPYGNYSVLALLDKNANYKYDLPNEEIAFLDSTVRAGVLDSSLVVLEMRSFLPASARQQIRTYTVVPDGAFELVFARPVDRVSVTDVARTGGMLTWSAAYNTTRDTVTLWPSDTTLLGQGMYEIRVADVALDTLRYRNSRKMPYYTGLAAHLVEEAGHTYIKLRSSRPLAALDTSKIILRSDSATIPFQTEQPDPRTVHFTFQARSGMPLQLWIPAKTIRDLYGGTNDSLRTAFGTAAERATGSLNVAITGLPTNEAYILQLLDGQQRVQSEAPVTKAAPTVEWKLLPPGIRGLRLVEDTNGNGRWDTGEWATLQQPERIWHHTEPTNVRASWDVKVDWVLPTP